MFQNNNKNKSQNNTQNTTEKKSETKTVKLKVLADRIQFYHEGKFFSFKQGEECEIPKSVADQILEPRKGQYDFSGERGEKAATRMTIKLAELVSA